jgi:hypothetical protein
MNTKIISSILSRSGRLFVAGLAAMTILAGRLQAQYVSTIISNGLNEPYGVTADPNNNVYITDAVNNRIVLYVPATKTASTFAGLTGTSGTNNGIGTAARFHQPQGIVYARGGLVVVDQYNQELRYVSLAGAVSNLAGVTGVYGTNNGAALGAAQFCYPTGIAVANDGATLYIADQGNNAIRMLSTNNVVSTIATSYLYNSVTNTFRSPAAVAVDNNNNVWVADSLNQVICLITNNGVAWVAQGIAGTYRTAGSNDSSALSGAQFNLPSGLLWDSVKNVLVISDTDNDTIRTLSFTNASNFSVQTVAGVAGTPGFIDGALGTAEFNHPFGLGVDTIDSGYYVADEGNNAVRVLQPAEPPPPPQPVANPVIGYVTFPLVGGVPSAQFNPITEEISIFNNPALLAIEQLDPTVDTYMSYGATGSVIPPPGTNTDFVQPFTQVDIGQASPFDVPSLNIPTIPDLTLETVSLATGRPSSATVSVEIQYVTANPNIIGNDAADILLSNVTENAQMFYTLDGSSPTNDGSNGVGPIASGTTLTLNITSNVTLTVRAFAPGFAPSGFVTEALTVSNFVGNQLTFGFASGQGSSQFKTAAGRYFYAPVTITELPNTTMYSLQFNLTEKSDGAAPAVNMSTWHFQSFLDQPVTINGATLLEPIPPGMFTNVGPIGPGSFTNDNLLGVGWIEAYPATNLYDTMTQDLTAFSDAHDVEFSEAGGEVLVGAYGFLVPTTATISNQYTIQAGLPSATTYYPPATAPVGVFMQAPTNGSLGTGAINAIKKVTVGVASYLVGDTYPFGWFNAGDFGDSNLLNDDVIEVFQSAIYSISTPLPNSDYFDAMDSSDGTYNNLYDANDADINAITLGDGKLKVDDVYVTFKRSLDTNLNWYIRNWSNGVETITIFTNFVSDAIHAAPSNNVQSQVSANGPHYITVAADQVQTGGGLSAQVPIRVLSVDTANYPLRVLMLNVEIDALDGSPPVTNLIAFSTGANLGPPTMSASQGVNNYGAAWLDSTVSGVNGTNIIGTLSVTLPPNVTSNSAYRVHFDHFSGSPNGLALFQPTVQDGLITVGNRSGSSWGDGIPDSWRLLWFGTISNALSAANADPDGDGASNWAEYVAGTNPNDSTSVFQFLPGSSFAPSSFTLQWQSVVNKNYSVQCSSSGLPGNWTTVASNILGNGQIMQWTDSSAKGQAAFYRAQVQ